MKTINVTIKSTGIVYSLNIDHILYFHRGSDGLSTDITLITGEKLVVKLSHTEVIDTIEKARQAV